MISERSPMGWHKAVGNISDGRYSQWQVLHEDIPTRERIPAQCVKGFHYRSAMVAERRITVKKSMGKRMRGRHNVL
jgi:hypothetical protein